MELNQLRVLYGQRIGHTKPATEADLVSVLEGLGAETVWDCLDALSLQPPGECVVLDGDKSHASCGWVLVWKVPEPTGNTPIDRVGRKNA